MHEVSLMTNLLDIVERTAAAECRGPVRLIHLKIGEMSGVNPEAMRFAFEVLSRGTAAEGATLEIERVPVRVRCSGCGAETSPRDLVFRCAECGCGEIEILTGREMEVDYILVGEDEAEACGAGS
jgi:hydrogenase nickel incorporation protein HypA/HybF